VVFTAIQHTQKEENIPSSKKRCKRGIYDMLYTAQIKAIDVAKVN
jgi:hypothetical protein